MKKFTFTWGTAMVLALLSFMILIVSLIVFYPRGTQNSFDLVTEDYYNHGLLFQDEYNARVNAQKLDQKPTIEVFEENIVVRFPDSIYPQEGKALLYRPSDKRLDRNFNLNVNANHEFKIADSSLTKGKYSLKIQWKKDKIPYQIEEDFIWK